MKIECTIRRKNGSSQKMGDQTYYWNDANGHVCEVENPEHAAVFLACPSSWRIAEGEQVSSEQPQPVADLAKPARAKPGRKPKATQVISEA